MTVYTDDGRRNSEGYLDMTAYKAMNNYIKKEVLMNYQRGDIVESITGGLMVIIAVHERYATALELIDHEADSNNYKVMAQTLMYTDTGRVRYIYYDKLGRFVKAMEETAFRNLLKAIGRTLDIPEVVEVEKVVEKPVEVPVEKIVEVRKESPEDAAKYAAIMAERDVYKALYTEMLNRLTKAS